MLHEATSPTAITTWGVFYIDGFPTKYCPLTYTVVIYADDNGQPSSDVIFERGDIDPDCCFSDIRSQTSGDTIREHQCDIDLLDENGNGPPELAAGRYWFSIISDTTGCSDAPSWWGWEIGADDVQNGVNGSLTFVNNAWVTFDNLLPDPQLEYLDMAWTLSNSTEIQGSSSTSSKSAKGSKSSKARKCSKGEALPSSLRGGGGDSMSGSKRAKSSKGGRRHLIEETDGDGDNGGLMKAMMMGDDGEEHPIMVAVRV